MVVCSCPHCKSYAKVRGGAKKPYQCKACGGFFNLSSVVSGVKKLASNPMVQQLAKAAAPHAMAALQKHAPGLASMANKAIGVAQRVAANPMVQRIASNPMVQNLARAAAPRALQALESRAPGLASAARSAASSQLGQQGISALRSKVGFGKKGRLGYESESDVEERSGQGRRRKAHSRYGRGGLGLGALLPVAGQVLGAIPGASESLGPMGALLGAPQQALPPPPPPVARFQGLQGFVPPQMMARANVMGRGRRTRPPTAHSLAVKEVMAQTGMGLPHASRYVKEHGLARRG
jgi:hypothetical protein